jgi:hypothetical protein
VNYSKKDILNAFTVLAGRGHELTRPATGAATHTIPEEKLCRALTHGSERRGAGGEGGERDPLLVEDILTMLEHNPGGLLDYQELVDLMMGIRETADTDTATATTSTGTSGLTLGRGKKRGQQQKLQHKS